MDLSNVNGRFIWYDLMTTDLKAAEAFYCKVVGWETNDAGLPDRTYTLFSMGSARVGGMMIIPADSLARGAKPGWMGHIGVDDVDAYVARVKDAGGAVLRAPEDIPNNIGRFAVVADPQGAVFLLFHGNGDPQPPTPQEALGHVGWNELYAGELDSAWAFYSGLFAWTKGMAVDMGSMGTYQTFMTSPTQGGGMMTKAPEMLVPVWGFYFTVDGVTAAVERATEAGGTLVNGPHQVPGGAWIAHCIDPQGAHFNVTGKNQ